MKTAAAMKHEPVLRRGLLRLTLVCQVAAEKWPLLGMVLLLPLPKRVLWKIKITVMRVTATNYI